MGGTNYELSQQFLVEVLELTLLRFLAFAVLVLLRAVLESIKDSGDLADLTVIDNQTRETQQLIVDYKLASESMDL